MEIFFYYFYFDLQVCCAPADKVRWVESRDGVVPPNAIAAGKTAAGEPLYVGRAREQGSLTPGKVCYYKQTIKSVLIL